MSPNISTCEECGASQNAHGECLNPNCSRAQHAATRDAARDTNKASAAVSRPSAFASSGRVD